MWHESINMGDVKLNTLIVGLGKTGLSCARFLTAQGVPLAVTDNRAQPPGLIELQQDLPDVAVFVGGFDPTAFAAAQQLIVSPGVSLREPLIAEAMLRGTPVMGDVELFARHAKAPVVAITGSNGKSTVTTLVGEMAEGGSPTQVTVAGGSSPMESLDGKWLYYSGDNQYDTALWRRPASGGAAEKVVESMHYWYTVGRSGVYYASIRRRELRYWNAVKREDRFLFEMATPLAMGLGVSPDERELCVSATQGSGSDIMMIAPYR